MTEKEIIKGLKCCVEATPGICKSCSYYHEIFTACSKMLMQDACNLINRQQAEIEKLTEKHWNECRQIAEYDSELKNYIDALRKYVGIIINQKAEIERCNRNMDSMVNEHDRIIKELRTTPVTFIPETDSKEAIKKFAEALKAELKNLSKVHLFGATFALVDDNFVDGFVAKYEKESEENA